MTLTNPWTTEKQSAQSPSSLPQSSEARSIAMNIEIQAERVVKVITKFIDTLRSLDDDWNDIPTISSAKKTTKSLKRTKAAENVYLFQLILEKTPEILDEVRAVTNGNSGRTIYDATSSSDAYHQVSHKNRMEEERWKLSHQILLPLLSALTKAYNSLDSLPQITPSEHNDTYNNDSSTNLQQRITKRKNRKHAPSAPRGLLSLSNYTDIACFVEFTICTSILPLLERFVLPNIEDRSKTIPKSLAGRLSKRSLQWGMNTLRVTTTTTTPVTVPQKTKISSTSIATDGIAAASEETKSKDTILTKQNIESKASFTSPQQKQKQQQQWTPQQQKIHNARNELTEVMTTITKCIFLDRFRPILLPRCLVELYATLFQIERLDCLKDKLGMNDLDKKDFNKTQDDVTFDELDIMYKIFLNHSGPKQQQQQQDEEKEQHENDDSSKLHSYLSQIQPLDAHTKAKSYQSILMSGRKTPIWLRSRVGGLLTDLATYDHNDVNTGVSGLQAIIDVFVIAASILPTEEISTASARLGRVLCTKSFPKTTEQSTTNQAEIQRIESYYEALLKQLGFLLGTETNIMVKPSKVSEQKSNGENGGTDDRAVANALTAWAILENVPHEYVKKYFFLPFLARGLVPLAVPMTDNNTVKMSEISHGIEASISRIYALFMYVPPKIEGSTGGVLDYLCQLFLSNIPMTQFLDHGGSCSSSKQVYGGSISIIGQILRVSCAGGNKAVPSTTKSQAISTIKMIVHTILSHCTFRKKETKDSMRGERTVEKCVVATILRTIAVNSWDTEGFRFIQSTKGPDALNCTMTIERISPLHSDTHIDSIDEINERVNFWMDTIIVHSQIQPELLAKCESGNDLEELSRLNRSATLPSTLFQLLLLVYFESSTADNIPSSNSYLPMFILSSIGHFKILSMMFLSILCEKCSPASLLLESYNTDSKQSSGVIQILSLIIYQSAKLSQTHESKEDGHSEMNTTEELKSNLNNILCDYSDSDLSELLHEENFHDDKNKFDQLTTSSIEDTDNTQLSITSIVLSLLIAMLELGSNKRSSYEEISFNSLLPPLRVLATLGDITSQTDSTIDHQLQRNDDQLILKAEIAEMASHGIGLILSRSSEAVTVPQNNDSDRVNISSPIDMIYNKVAEAEILLNSNQPPMRAKAVVLLRTTARGTLQELVLNNKQENFIAKSVQNKNLKRNSLIQELNDDGSLTGEERDPLDNAVEALLWTSIKSLNDSDSYVYLAGIQTVVAIADVSPSNVMPILILATISGKVQLHQSKETTISEQSLSTAQRIKLAEAVVFTIRRRGQAIQNHARMILNLILYGKGVLEPSANSSSNDAKSIQKNTESYFRQDQSESDLLDIKANYLEERQLRVNTGGPVFDIEEEDILRAAYITIITELVSMMWPGALVPYCSALLRLAINSLRLDHSRPVRRVAAMLCREIYACTLREISANNSPNNFGGNGTQNLDIQFTKSLVISGEEALWKTLQRCINSDDVDLIKKNGSSSKVQGKTRLHDPATIARCTEALDIRTNISDEGIFTAAAIIINKEKETEKSPLDKFLKKELEVINSTKGQPQMKLW